MGKTEENLKAAFAGESQANRKYLFFAEKAELDGFKQIARLFRAAADAETVHAKMHLRTLNGIGSTADNLQVAISGEYAEFTDMYPGFMKVAQEEGSQSALMAFTAANKVEEIHHGMFANAASALKESKDLNVAPIFVCQVCGNTVEGEAPERCPICGVPKSSFKAID